MPIIHLLIILVLIGCAVGAMYKWAPMPEAWKRGVGFIVGLVTVLWLLSLFGIWDMGGTIGHVRTR